MDIKKLNDYIVTLDTEELLSRYKNESGKWSKECIQLCYLELAKRGALIENNIQSEDTIRLNINKYKEWIQDEDCIKGLNAQDNEQYKDAKQFYENSIKRENPIALTHLGILYHYGDGCEKDFEKAYNCFSEALKYKYPLAAEWLAEMYCFGKYVNKDKEKAKEIISQYKTAIIDLCIYGDKYCQYMYGFDVLHGLYEEKNVQEGILWLQKAAEAGHKTAAAEIALCFLKGEGYEQDISHAINMLLDICRKSNNRKANYELGKIYYSGKYIEKNYSEALKFLKVAAEQGHSASQEYVADIYYDGCGTEVDYVEARKWYELAAKNNRAYAFKQLGFIYYYGEGVQENDDEAFKYFSLAAGLGHNRSKYMLHHFYFADGKYKDYKKGKKYLEESAESGDVLAQKMLARCYVSDYGFNDDDKFFEWMMKAAESEDPEAERIIAGAFVNGLGTEENIDEATQWYSKAIDHGDLRAIYELAEIYITGDEDHIDVVRGYKLLEKADKYIAEKKGKISAYDYCEIADLYGKSADIEMLKKALYYYCVAYLLDKNNHTVLVNICMLYFAHNLELENLNENEHTLIQKLKETAETEDDSTPACMLGDIYFHGYRNIKVDQTEAVKWYLIALAKGSSGAGVKVAVHYLSANYSTEIKKKAIELLNMLDARNYTPATYYLGLCYKKGIVVQKDKQKAKSLFKKAADMGNEAAKAELNKFIF